MAPRPDAADASAAGDHERAARRLLELTRGMLDLGRQGDWVLFSRREEERRCLARAIFATPVPRLAAPAVAECIRGVLELGQELIALAAAHRDNAARAMRDFQRGRQAADIYRRCSR